MKILIAMGLALFVQSSFAVSIAGKEFAAVADTFVGQSSAFFTDNDPTQTPTQSITDTDTIVSPASGIMSGDSSAYMDLAFNTDVDVFDGVGVDLSIFFLGDDGDHSIDLTLFKAGGAASTTRNYSITPSLANYTGFFVDNDGDELPSDGDISIYFMDIDLADFNFLGTDPLAKFRMDISGYSAVPSLIGAYPSSMSPVPVPAAVWLFGSGLIGLVGVARRKK